jgi:hypothetical protein
MRLCSGVLAVLFLVSVGRLAAAEFALKDGDRLIASGSLYHSKSDWCQNFRNLHPQRPRTRGTFESCMDGLE